MAAAFSPNVYSVQIDSRGLNPDSGQQITVPKKSKRNVENLHIVLLQDAPLAGYHGEKSHLTATSVQSNPSNKNQKTGLLNVKSSVSKTYIAHLKSTQQQVLNQAQSILKRDIKAEINYQIVLNGFSTRLSEHEIEQLKQLEQVKSIIKVKPNYLTTDSGPSHIKAPTAWNGSATGLESQGEGVIVGIMDTGISPFNSSFADEAADGYNHTNPLGEGVYLGDCNKSDLAEYCNDKLIGIWAHPGILDDYTPEGDDKIGVDHNGHGSHTASTTAGNVVKDVPVFNVLGDKADFKFNQISGVAPRANIVSYQVCDGSGSCWPDVTAQAVEHAIVNGVKVINYSVGGAARSPWDSADSQAFLAAREAGIHVATSAGNSGPGPETVGSPGNAPWVTTVAAYTHDRSFTDKNISFTGGETELATITGKGATKGFSGAVLDAADFGDAQCLSPFEENTFDNQIVICERGEIARVAKGKNVKEGGAGGMIFMNLAGEEQAKSVDADLHVLPAIHVNAEDGQKIRDWLASGNDHQATFENSDLTKDSDLADIAAVFTSRGPESVFNRWMTPHVAAPGVDIYAANSEYQPHTPVEDRTESPYTFMSGTSMASPHVAGALTLIASLKPEWTPAEAQSALMLTTEFDTKKEDGITPSDFFDAGSGSIRIDKALNTGLIMDVTYDEYVAANPDEDGSPESLNMPAMLAHDCLIRCTWTRTFTATETATWNSSQGQITEGVTITAEPSSFSLAKGESIDVAITAEIGEGFDSDYGFGRLMLTPNNADLSASALPVIGTFVAGSFPENQRIETSSATGVATISGIKTIVTDELQIAKFELAEVETIDVKIPRDDSDTNGWPTNVWNDEQYNYAQKLNINSNVKRIVARIKSTTSPDLDMYIGRDSNLNGKPDSYSEFQNLLCMSADDTAFESCVINNPEPGSYYLAVHNFGDTSAPSTTVDDISIELAVIGKDDNSITVTAPETIVSEDAFDISIAWDKPLKRDTLYMTALELGSGANTPDNIGLMPIEIYRNANLVGGSLNTTSATTGDTLTATIDLVGNDSDAERTVSIELTLPEAVNVNSDSHNGQLEANVISWEIAQAANSADEAIVVELGTDSLVKSKQLMFELGHTIADESISETIGMVDFSGVTVAKINGESDASIGANEQTLVTLAATGSSVPGVEDTISYEWSQTSGPEVEISDTTASEIEISVPDVSSDAQVVITLTVTNGESLDTATATINVKAEQEPVPEPMPEKKNSGGALGFMTLALGLIALRRKNRK
nr:S8 family serine peptidase [Parashewanella hymeniacidonis]